MVMSLVLDAGSSFLRLPDSAMVSPFIFTASTPTRPDLNGSSAMFSSMKFCALVFGRTGSEENAAGGRRKQMAKDNIVRYILDMA